MNILYNLGIFFYSLYIKAGSFFHPKAKLFINGRKDWGKNLKEKISKPNKYIWFHCASLGEFEQGRPVIEEIKKKYPQYKILLTFFSPSGYEIRKNYEKADIVCYLPLDTKKNAQRFINIVSPEIVFFIKYEFWHHYIREINKRGISLYGISVIFRKNQIFFSKSPWGKWFKNILSNYTHFFTQNQESCNLLKNIDIHNYTLAGDTRFDRVSKITDSPLKISIIEQFKNKNPLIVIGSSWKADEELLFPFINNSINIKFIIAPHEVSESNIIRIKKMLINPSIRFSDKNVTDIGSYQVMIIDSIGLLSSIYQYGDIAYIGGGFGVGIHNILEAVTFGLPVIFGPNYLKFYEACQLIEEGGAYSIDNKQKLEDILTSLINNPERLKKISQSNTSYIVKNTGSTSKIIQKVFKN